jgi:hypothetical protein
VPRKNLMLSQLQLMSKRSLPRKQNQAALAKKAGVVEPGFGLAYVKSSFDRHSYSDDSMRRGSHKEIKKVRKKRKWAKNLKDGKDYKTGDPWDKFLLTEIGEHYYAVDVGKDRDIFGIYANLEKFQKETEGVIGSIYGYCESYAEAHQYLEDYLQKQKQDPNYHSDKVALAAMKKKIFVLGYEDLTQNNRKQLYLYPREFMWTTSS